MHWNFSCIIYTGMYTILEGAIHLATGTIPNHDTPQSTRRSREILPCVVQHCTCSDVKSLIRASNRASLFSIISLTLMFSFYLLTSPRCSYACVFTNPNWRMTTDSSCILSIIGNDEHRAISGHDHNTDETWAPEAKMHLIINQCSCGIAKSRWHKTYFKALLVSTGQ